MKIDLDSLTIKKAHSHLLKGDFSVLDLTESYLKKIEEKNPEINAFLEVFDDCKKQAETAQKLFSEKKATFLTGIPFAIKDNIMIKDRTVSAASKILENYKATYDATVVKKLREQGAILLGRTNMDEFALGGSTEKSAFGVTRNPSDVERVPGGTSGGSAASIAGGMSLVALGSDTGGSVRQPSSFCGCVGLKPTYGAVSRYGLIAAVSSFDQIGPITKNVSDAEIIFKSISGNDSMDSTTTPKGAYDPYAKTGVVGIPAGLINQQGLNAEVALRFKATIETLKEIGYSIKEIDLPDMSQSLAVYYILNFAEVSSNLARYDGVKFGFHKDGKDLLEDYILSRTEGFGREARKRILLGTHILSAGYYDAYYNRAMTLKGLLTAKYKEIFKEVDVILTPTAPTPAYKIGEKMSDPLEMYLADIFTVTANIIGVPAISIPAGTACVEGKDLPVGMQFMSAHGNEDVLFEIGKKFLEE